MIVVADTSVVLNLTRVGQENLLRDLFHEVWIPREVAREFDRQASLNPRFTGLRLRPWLQIREPAIIPDPIRSHPLLDAGEQSALALALEIHADAVLIDEANGRAVAAQLGLTRIGILGILLQAKAAGLVVAILPILDDLQQQADFWLSLSLRRVILKLAREHS